jgi:hypothetical protein
MVTRRDWRISAMAWEWINTGGIGSKSYVCGFCGNRIAPNTGYLAKHAGTGNIDAYLCICPNCTNPTFIDDREAKQVPGVRPGSNVMGISDEGVKTLYNQARDCMSLAAYTAATLLCRKILMNLAAQQGAKPGESFVGYITYLDEKGYVPPNGKKWVDRIRTKGNEATHEIRLTDKQEASQVLTFTEMLLRFVYEFPSMLGENDQGV